MLIEQTKTRNILCIVYSRTTRTFQPSLISIALTTMLLEKIMEVCNKRIVNANVNKCPLSKAAVNSIRHKYKYNYIQARLTTVYEVIVVV